MAVKLIDAVYSEFSKDPTTLIKSYVMDAPEDVSSLPASAAGSTAIVAAKNGSIYMVNASGEWKDVSGGGSSGGGESGGGGASLETCTVTLFYGADAFSVTYSALVDGKLVAKVLNQDDAGDDGFVITDIVKGSTLSVFNDGWGAFAPSVFGDAEKLYDDTYYRNFCYAINGDCDFSFWAD